MAICIPEEPEFGAGFEAERAVWEKLRAQLPDDAVVVHSLAVRHGRAEHEIDLLVLWPGVGMAAIEVKGGRVSVENGRWYQSDRGGRHGIGSPMAQAQGAGHALVEWLADRMGTRLSSRFAHVVCLPYTPVPRHWEMAGIPRGLVLDAGDTNHIADRLREAIEGHGGGTGPLAASFLERILPHLRADLDPGTPDDAAAAGELEDEQDALTVRQQTLLNATRSLTRVRFLGGAGSGKTWLAVAKAKELCRAGNRVALICYNRGLGGHLRRQVEGWRHLRPAFTGGFHEYALSLGIPDGEGQEYYDVEMPRLLREAGEALPEDQRLDAVVVDEAQDLAPEWWEALLACTTDPARVPVYAFMDDRQDVYRRWDGEALGGSFGQATALVPIHVDDNLRNTRRIAEAFKPLAGEYFRPRCSTGLPVRFVECATEDALDAAGDCVDALIEEGWANNQIALLTTRHRHPIHQEHFDAGTVAEYWAGFHAQESEFYGHVLGFKGLERSVVILCVNGFKEAGRAAEQLYVGLSRARSLLVVVGDPALIEESAGPEVARALDKAERWAPAPA